MELDENQSIRLCLSPLLIYALLSEIPLHTGPRGEWQLLRALEEGLQGDDPLSLTLVDGLKSNLHKFFAYFCQHYAQATADELLAALANVRRTLDELAAKGCDPAGCRRTLVRFTEVLAVQTKEQGHSTAVRQLLA
ncbi:hypothetical protein JCM30471_16740 [Desulfuromonas carbonis]|uniref:hypothetical protein n=1 Tax=Desulfuromonas sp. DDH964 TaxID=1823759 RepID=UPI00078CF944|nr:hypothetical protein [Desulfuromonas sp. DDH964]AMV73272.1 hypothetical protein DBW_2963 [Desulfuromonas sp. DDH964]